MHAVEPPVQALPASTTPPRPATFGGADVPSYDQLVQCMRCGMCLPTCPTYQVTRLELDSPRGRIRLIKAVADGDLGLTPAFVETMSFCLDCRACETACPAGVQYGGLVEAARAQIQNHLPTPWPARLPRQFLLNELFWSKGRLRAAAAALRLYQWSGLEDLVRSSGLTRLAPPRLRELEAMRPTVGPLFPSDPLPTVTRPAGTPRHRVALLSGCVMDFLCHDVHRDTIEVLMRNGCEVRVPPRQGCCGSLHGHTGDPETARRYARRNIEAFDAGGLDAVIVNAAGCGSFMRQYGGLFERDPAWRARARAFSAKVRDVSEFLVEIGFERPQEVRARVTYHEACHLVHGQKVSAQPRQILRCIPGVEFVELPEATWCCGSAGTYNVTRPEDAKVFLDRKMDNLARTNAEVVATGNPGCAAQLEAGIRARGLAMRVAHPVSLLAEGYRREKRGNS